MMAAENDDAKKKAADAEQAQKGNTSPEVAEFGKDPNFLVRINALFDAMLKTSPMLKTYINSKKLQLWFDLPEKRGDQPSNLTLCIYLHSLSENTTLRHGNTGHWGQTKVTADTHNITSVVIPGYVNITCNYLFILWDPSPPALDQTLTQGAVISSDIIQTLINTVYVDDVSERFNVDFPWISGHFIQNSERMESLGSFWQSMEMRPRLCMHYELTVPVAIAPPQVPLALYQNGALALDVDINKARAEADEIERNLSKLKKP